MVEDSPELEKDGLKMARGSGASSVASRFHATQVTGSDLSDVVAVAGSFLRELCELSERSEAGKGGLEGNPARRVKCPRPRRMAEEAET